MAGFRSDCGGGGWWNRRGGGGTKKAANREHRRGGKHGDRGEDIPAMPEPAMAGRGGFKTPVGAYHGGTQSRFPGR